MGAWHLAFLAGVGIISARGLNRGIEIANRIRGPLLLALMLILVVYALMTGDVVRAARFALLPSAAGLSGAAILAAIGQAFFATGVGMAMMIAYGAYVPRGTSLVRAALLISGSIVLVSLLATALVFPLVFRYGMDPAAGPALVFDVLPTAFAEMPAGRLIETSFFLLLVLAALTPSLAAFEPVVAWLEQRGLRRDSAAGVTAALAWVVGLGSVLSFSLWSHWYPFGAIPGFATSTFFDIADFVSSNVLLPLGALLTCALIGWWQSWDTFESELIDSTTRARRACRFLLRYVCPVAILGVFAAAYL